MIYIFAFITNNKLYVYKIFRNGNFFKLTIDIFFVIKYNR